MEWNISLGQTCVLTLDKREYMPEALPQVNEFPDRGLLPLSAEVAGEQVTLTADVQNLRVFGEYLAQADDRTGYALLRGLFAAIREVDKSAVLRRECLEMDLHSIFVQENDQVSLLYTPVVLSDADGQQSADKLLEQLRQLEKKRPPSEDEKVRRLREMIADPYVTVNMLCLHCESVTEQQVGAMQASATHPVFTQIPQFTAPVQQTPQQPVIRAQNHNIAMQPAPIAAYAEKAAYAAPKAPAAPPFTSGIAVGMDEATQAPVAMGMDEATQAPAPVHVGADQPTQGEAPAAPPAPPARRQEAPRPRQASPDRAPVRQSVQAAKPDPVQEEEAQEKEISLTTGRAYAVLGVLMVFSVLIGLFISSLLGGIGLFFYLLMLVVGAVWLYRKGFFQYLIRKKEAAPEPDAPELLPVFDVRIKLQSVNLAKRVEVTIRAREQIIGADEKSCLAPLPFRGVSRRHCKITCVERHGNASYYITDLGSKNGTELNGVLLQPDRQYPVYPGDQIVLAHRYKFVVHSDAY
ncbi:MAG: FHA domain-containing protein [Clostridia bacterium]|nr:FHA domain-containing protein [Clostridia bacterium]